MITNYVVSGITCGHCVKSITEELESVPGVERVELDTTGALTLTSADVIGLDVLTAAVAEAGDSYSIVAA